jgi:hypothetical protein
MAPWFERLAVLGYYRNFNVSAEFHNFNYWIETIVRDDICVKTQLDCDTMNEYYANYADGTVRNDDY